MGKRLLSMLLAVCMVLSLASTALAEVKEYKSGRVSIDSLNVDDIINEGVTLERDDADLTVYFAKSEPETDGDDDIATNHCEGTSGQDGELLIGDKHKDDNTETTIKTYNDKWVVDSVEAATGTVTLYPQIMGAIKFDDSIGTSISNTFTGITWYIAGKDQLPHNNEALSDDAETTLPVPTPKPGYSFEAWHTAQQTDATFPTDTKITDSDISTLADKATAQEDLTKTLYAHYHHVHDWKYETPADDKTGYLYCANANDEYDECAYHLTTGETATDAKLYVTLTANNVSYDGEPYDSNNNACHWYEKTDKTPVEITTTRLSEIDSKLAVNTEPWGYKLGNGDKDETTSENSGASANGKAPVKRGSYLAYYKPYTNGDNVTCDVTAIVGLPFTIGMGVQTVKPKLGENNSYDYNGAVPTPSYINGDLKETATVKYYYTPVSNYTAETIETVEYGDLTKAGTVWTEWVQENITGTTLPVGTYYMAIAIGATDNYGAYVATTTFTVGGKTLEDADVTAKVVYKDATDEQKDAAETIVYDGNEYYVVVTAKDGDKTDFTVKYGTDVGECTVTDPAELAEKDADTYTVYYEISADGYNTKTGSTEYTIGKKTLYATATAKDKTYDGTDTATLQIQLHEGSANGTALNDAPTTGFIPTGVGEEKLKITIGGKFPSKNVVLNDEQTAAAEQVVTPDLSKISIEGKGTTDPDNYEINTDAIEAAINPESDDQKIKATIKRRVVEFTWSETEFVYNGKEHTVTATVSNKQPGDTDKDFSIVYVDSATDTGVAANVVNHATAVGQYRARVKSIGNTNYMFKKDANGKKDVASRTQLYNISYVTGCKAQVIGTLGDNGWYKSEVTLKAPDGFKISKTGTANSWTDSITVETDGKKEGKGLEFDYYLKRDSDGGLTDVLNETNHPELNVDYTKPVITDIKCQFNSLMQKLNNITFGHFFTKTLDITITASDDKENTFPVDNTVSGVAKIEYKYEVYDASTQEWTVKTTGTDGWVEYDNGFSIKPNDIYRIYARATDDAGNVSDPVVYVSDGTVLYTQSTPTDEVEYTKLAKVDVPTDIEIYKNTIETMKLSGVNGTTYAETPLTALNKAGDNTDVAWYKTVTNEGHATITLLAKKLNDLPAGNYQIVVTYNPNGVAYSDGVDDKNDAPQTSTITLTVKKAPHVTENHDNLPAAPVVESVTTNTVTLKNVNNVDPKHNDTHAEDDTTFAYNKDFEVEWSIKGSNKWQKSNVFTGLSSGTKYEFVARYAENDTFLPSAESASVTATTTAVKRSSHSSGGSSATYYTVTVTAGAGGSADVGKVNVRSGRNKTINFTPNAGYVVADVVVNGKSVGACASYTLTNITKDTSVKVTFTQSANSVIVSTPTVINPSTGAGI